MGFAAQGISLWHKIPAGTLNCGDLLEKGYGADGGFLITRMGELWCDSIPMYGFNGPLTFHHLETKTTYVCEAVKGALQLVMTKSPLDKKDGKK